MGNVTLGGQPGEYPTCMVGTMFYKSHSIIKDSKKGLFDKDEARTQLRSMEQMARKTGMQFIVDVVGNSAETLVKYCEFVADATENSKQPFLMDGLSDEIRIPAMKILAEKGLQDRLIYNSIEPKISEESIKRIKEFGVKNAVLLAFDSRMLLPKHKIKLIDGWGDKIGKKEGLIEKAKRAGVDNYILDVAVLDMPSIGIAGRTIEMVKEKNGLPCGCAPSNAIFECKGLKQFGKEGRTLSLAAACGYLASSGADFILFGPVKYAKETFLSVANVDSFLAYTHRRIDKIKPKSEFHPLYKIF